MSAFGSVEALDNWAVDGETGTPKGYATRPGDQAVLHKRSAEPVRIKRMAFVRELPSTDFSFLCFGSII
jgi:hypothetical protein